MLAIPCDGIADGFGKRSESKPQFVSESGVAVMVPASFARNQPDGGEAQQDWFSCHAGVGFLAQGIGIEHRQGQVSRRSCNTDRLADEGNEFPHRHGAACREIPFPPSSSLGRRNLCQGDIARIDHREAPRDDPRQFPKNGVDDELAG